MAVIDFKERFLEKVETLTCSEILEGFGDGGQQMGSAGLTAEAVILVAEELAQFEVEAQGSLEESPYQPREKVALGNCPFRATA